MSNDVDVEVVTTYHVTPDGTPVSFTVSADSSMSVPSWYVEITQAEYDDLIENPPAVEIVPIDPSLAQPELTPLEKLESIGLSVEELRTLLNENA